MGDAETEIKNREHCCSFANMFPVSHFLPIDFPMPVSMNPYHIPYAVYDSPCPSSNFLLKHRDISLYKDKQHDQRQNIRHIHPCPFREPDSLSAVRFLCKLLPSPSITTGAEQKINQTAKRKQIVAYQEIFKIQNIFSCAQRRNPTPYIKSENTWNR